MELKNYLKSYQGMKVENNLHRICIILSFLIILVLIFMLFRKEQIVVITPYTLNSDSWVGKDKGAQSYKEAWALFFAQELGNVTPDNVDFLRARIGPLLSSSVYKDFMEALGIQSQQLKEDRVVLRFEPSSVEYEPESDKTFVSGRLYTRGFNDKESSEQRTYEFKIAISNYAPRLMWMNTYRDLPRTISRLKQLRSKKSNH